MLEELTNIKNDLQEYFEVRMDNIRLHLAENLSEIFSNAINIFIIGYLIFFILFFLSLAAGFLFGSLLHSNELGFLCIAGLYFIVLLIFLIFKKQIIERPVIKAMVRLLFPKFNDDEK